MEKKIIVPSMGESISEVIVGSFIQDEGSIVSTDDELLEIETDKVNQVLYSPDAGRVHYTVKEGDRVAVGDSVGYVDTEEKGEEKKEDKPAEEVAHKLAEKEHGENLRLEKNDFLEDVGSPKKRKPEELPGPLLEEPKAITEVSRTKMSQIRRIIASRMVEAKQKMAILTTFNEVDMSGIIRLREEYKETFEKEHGNRLGFLSFVIKAVVAGLRRFPILHSRIEGDEVVRPHLFDIGIAVATDRGLVVPVLRNCEPLSFGQMEKQIHAFATKAREGKLLPEDLQGGSFTITNGGVFGSLLSTPIINPPQSAILGMHAIQNRPIALDNEIVIRPMMYLALSYDHRLIDGREAVLFLNHIKSCLENPGRLLLDI